MAAQFEVGDIVRLVSLPDWLIHDLPEAEQREMLAFVGQTAAITEIDVAGYFWLGFGQTMDDGDGSLYTGHSFCVTPDCLGIA